MSLASVFSTNESMGYNRSMGLNTRAPKLGPYSSLEKLAHPHSQTHSASAHTGKGYLHRALQSLGQAATLTPGLAKKTCPPTDCIQHPDVEPCESQLTLHKPRVVNIEKKPQIMAAWLPH